MNEKPTQHSWIPNVLSDSGGKVCRNCGVVSECSEIACKPHPTFRGIPGFPADNEKAPIPEAHCTYCDEQACDHKHPNGHSCGNCCAMHGGLASEDAAAYRWVERCLDAKNQRIAALTAEVDALKENLRLSRDNENLLRYERNSLRKQIETEKDLAAENDALKAGVARLSAPVTVAELKRHGAQGLAAVSACPAINALILARAPRRRTWRSRNVTAGTRV